MHAAVLCRRGCASRLLAAGRDAPAALRCAGGVAAPSGGGDAFIPSASAAATPPPERGGAPPPLYDGHIRLSGVQRAALAVGSAVGALWAPARADLVATLGETTGHAALERMRRRMAADPQGVAMLRDMPRITDATLQACWNMPPGSFGLEYAQFMGVRSFSPAERPPVRFVDDAELAYVAARAREVHDLWHVLFACDTSVLGELALKAVEALQTGLPSAALAAAAGPLRLPRRRRAAYAAVYLPWALRAGSRAADLMCIRYEDHFTEPIDQLRAQWRVEPAPARAAALALAAEQRS